MTLYLVFNQAKRIEQRLEKMELQVKEDGYAAIVGF